MRLGVSMYCYVRAVKAGAMDITDFIKEAKRIGAEGVELLDFFYTDPSTERHQIKETLLQQEMPCGVFSVANNFAKESAEERKAQADRIKFGVDEAVFYGASVVRVFAGDVSEHVSFEQARDWIVQGLSESADYAQSRGIKLALENHGKLAGQGSQVQSLVAEVRERCGHDTLGANPDTGNFVLVDQASHEAVAQVADISYMCHFKDFAPGEGVFESLSGKRYRGAVIGEGCVDLPQCVAALKAKGFDGWVNLEYEGEGDPIVEVERSLINAKVILAS